MNRHGATTKSYLNQPLLLFTTHNQQQVDIKKTNTMIPQLPASSDFNSNGECNHSIFRNSACPAQSGDVERSAVN
jgi:hypothetical protein